MNNTPPAHNTEPLMEQSQHLVEQAEPLRDQVLGFLYTLSDLLGQFVLYLVNLMVPADIPDRLVQPIGFLCLITIFLLMAEIAKKIAWIVLVVGWVLIAAQIGLIWLEASGSTY